MNKKDQIAELKELITQQNILQKKVLTFNEAVRYLGISRSHLYKLTSKAEIPFYKPNGKKLYFKMDELNAWLTRNRNASRDEVEDEANEYLTKKSKINL